MTEDRPAIGNFKLSLQSIICHRGLSVDSGHYLSAVRYPITAKNRGSESPAPSDQWLRHDDLAKERVMRVNVEQYLKHETPYLLFYQVQPIDSDASDVTGFTENRQLGGHPPAYADSIDHESSGPATSVKTDSGISETSQIPPETLPQTSKGSQPKPMEINGDRLRPSGDFKRGRFGLLSRTNSSDQSSHGNTGGHRLSASFSRTTNNVRISRPTSTISSTDPDVQPDSISPSLVADQPHIQPSTPELYDNGKLKKEPQAKGKAKEGHQHHHVLIKGRHHKAQKPDRECCMM